MTTKQFLHSTTFRCIIVLLCIALVAGALLSILNDLWSISNEERINRAIKSVCGDGVTLKEEVTISDADASNQYGHVDSAYLLSNDKYLITTTGGEGYHSGTVSCYILATATGEIETVSIAGYASSQTLMSKFTAAILDEFKKDPQNYVATGASYSSKAIRNAINAAQYYIDNCIANN